MVVAHMHPERVLVPGNTGAVRALILHAEISMPVLHVAAEAAPVLDQLPARLALETVIRFSYIFIDEGFLHRRCPG